jgi:hypothetical protein
VTHPGAGDCEALRPGLLAQPVNALTSLAYVAVGAELLNRDAPGRRPETSQLSPVFGALLITDGIGGVAFHGPGNRSAKWLHDVALVGTLAFIGLHDAALLMRTPGRPELAGTILAVTGLGAVLAIRPTGTNAAAAMAGATAAGLELAVLATAPGRGQVHLRPSRRRAALLLAAAAAIHLLSRTGGPLCRPNRLVQGHGVWHLLTAAALRTWARPLVSPGR